MKWLLVFGFGGLGAVARVAVSGLFPVQALPWGTLAVNLAGCVAIGVLFTLFEEHGALALELRIAIVGGLLGGFTTFSAFGLETFELLAEGRIGAALAYAVGSLVLGVAGVTLGAGAARALS